MGTGSWRPGVTCCPGCPGPGLPDAGIRFVDTGHFALETHAEEIAAAIDEFLVSTG